MKDIVTRCGYRCNLCLAYKENIKDKSVQQKVSDGWFKYYGFRIPAEEIYCDGCLSQGEGAKLIDPNCPVRACVIEKKIENCAHCEKYICEVLKSRIVNYNSIAERIKEPIPKEDYENFIKPYESRKVLNNIRRKLKLKTG